LAQKHLRALERPEPVRVDKAGHRLLIGDATIKLSPAQAWLYTAFARIKTEKCEEQARKNCDDCIACYRTISKENWDSVREELETLAGERFLSAGIGYFRTIISKTTKALARDLGSEHLARIIHG
jgi:hypothetical protein